MVRINKFGEVFVKILYWGCAGSGKTTAVDTLYRLTKDGTFEKDVTPTGNLTKIVMASGSKLSFDRGIFQSKRQAKIFYHVYTVPGQARFSFLRKKIFLGTDGVIFVFNAQRSKIEDNLNSLKELKNFAGNKQILDLPILVMVNKQDLPNALTKSEVREILFQEGIFYPKGHKLNGWNPKIYETIAYYPNALNIYEVFAELAKRTSFY
ncbi:MAG: ADP-ribosylation factor-like protein [Promethearchaeota archaeon]